MLFRSYRFVGIPLAVAMFVVMVGLRPTYLMACCDLYQRRMRDEPVLAPVAFATFVRVIVVLALLLGAIWAFVAMRTSFGLE